MCYASTYAIFKPYNLHWNNHSGIYLTCHRLVDDIDLYDDTALALDPTYRSFKAGQGTIEYPNSFPLCDLGNGMQEGTALFNLPDVTEFAQKFFLVQHVDCSRDVVGLEQSPPIRPIHIYENVSRENGDHCGVPSSPAAGYALAKWQIVADSEAAALLRDFLLSS